MPRVFIYRSRVRWGNDIRGHIFSFDPIVATNDTLGDMDIHISDSDQMLVETPAGYELSETQGVKRIPDPNEGPNAYMDAARVVARIQQKDSGFRIVQS